MIKHKFAPKNIYNCDETGISTVQDPGKILAPKGQKRVDSITSWERGKNITLLCAMSAAGGFVPPMFISPRKRMTPQLDKGGPAGSLYKCSDNGWINEDLFHDWLKHFTSYAKPTVEEPMLLILDNHASHTSLAVYEHCKENNIHMLSLPPHTSHRMQPLDISFYGPLKAANKKECNLFLKTRLAETITLYDVASLFNNAYSSVASISKGESGFRASGIFPLNPNVFSQKDFIAAEVLNESVVVVHDSVVSVLTTDGQIPSTSASVTTTKDQMPSFSVPIQTIAAQMPCSSMVSTTDNQMPSMSTQSNQPSQIINTLLPIPKGKQSLTTRKGRAKQHAKILTTTPLKESLIDKENKKITKKIKKILKKNENNKKSAKTVKGRAMVASKKRLAQQKSVNKAKRRVLQDSNSSTESDISLTNICDDNEDDDAEDAGNICLICSEFGRNNEIWYRCTSCGLWAHAECTGWDSPEGYVCDNC